MSLDIERMDRVAKGITGQFADPAFGTPQEIVAGALWAAYGLVRHNYAGTAEERQAAFLAIAKAIAEDIEQVTGARH